MKTTPFLSALLLSLLALGCATEGPYPPASRTPSPEVERKAVILDKEIGDRIAVDSYKSERTPQGKLKAMANVRNRTNQDLTVQVQTVFRDAEGFSIEDDTSWNTVVLTANETRTIVATSTSKKAESYTVRIRMMR